MDETRTSTTTTIGTTRSGNNRGDCVSASNSGANNMETKSINIPIDVHHAEHTTSDSGKASRSSCRENTGEATTTTTVSAQSNTTTKTTQDDGPASVLSKSAIPTTASGVVNISEKDSRENGERDSQSQHQNIGEPDIPHQSNSISTRIDLRNESITNTLAVNTQSTEGRDEATVEKGEIDLKSGCSGGTNANLSESLAVVDKVVEESDQGSVPIGAFANGVNNSCTSSKAPVPNFRVEGSGAGDSSITVAVASLSSAVSASVTLHSGGARGGSTGGSNSLENGDQPGSSSGPVSIQSSEEMRLSLVSWYSEPDDPSRLIEGCCSALNTYRHENGIVEEAIASRDICGSNGSMGHEAITSVATNESPACKSESEEKENKTPEPCGNFDKMNGGGNDEAGTKGKEFINLNPIDINDPASDNKINSGNQDAFQNSQLANKCSGEGVGSKKLSGSCKSVDSLKAHVCTSQKPKSQVQVAEQNQLCNGSMNTPTGGGHVSRCHQDSSGHGHRHSKPECPRCSRRSKSGTTTPSCGSQVARTRTPANRRVVQSSKSSTEIKKPIKSILKHDSRGSAGSGSGSDKQSSMDSLGSSGDIGVTPVHILRGRMPASLMTRSDSGTRARFNFNSGSSCAADTPTGTPEDKAVSKLKRIEKYATLRVRKQMKPKPLDLSDSENHSNDAQGGVVAKTCMPGIPNELMSKSMSYLEKSSSNRVHISSTQGHESTSASSTLKRQGSLRLKKNTPPQWEPSGTRTSALRLQKMQAAKAKNSPGGGASSGSANSGSAHSGSGDSLHYLPHSANSMSASGGSSGMSSIHLSGAHSASASHGRMSASVAAKEKHMGAKIFSKLSSALGQTASSNQKRLRQERGVQTEVAASAAALEFSMGLRMSLSPIPALDPGPEATEQIKNLERLCTRYRNQVLKIQSDFEKSESKKVELIKQLEETQTESTEMIEFLQAEKSTLAESLTEIEVEAQKYKDEMEAVKRDYQSRCSSLVRLSEQHKQEALKSQALLHRLESQSTSVISQLSHQITDGAQSVHQTKQRVTALTDSLLKTYKVPAELLASSESNQTIKETDLSCSLLLPLITSLSAAFPMVPIEVIAMNITKSHITPSTGNVSVGHAGEACENEPPNVTVKVGQTTPNLLTSQSTSLTLTESTSFQSLNQAILEREAAEKSGLDDIMKPFSLIEGSSPDADQLSLKKEITELNAAIAKLLNVVRVIVIHCDRKVSSVASSILQCLKSIEDDKGGNMAEIAQVQKSLEAWSDNGMSGESPSTTSPPCKTTITSTTVGTPSTYLVGNGHARI